MSKLTETLASLKTQKVWIIIAILTIALYVYGELTATRLFAGTATEQWKPQGPNSQNSLHHK
ncbi:MAG TPA: hypothetical protein VKG26_09210 [Bacteroidia bacterium]|nr:hypothetical protein [Bacteroidia bacterium]